MNPHQDNCPLPSSEEAAAARLRDLETRQAKVEERQAALERRIAELEADAARQVPWPWTWPPFIPQDSSLDRCNVCGGLWKDMTHYVCTNPNCPGRVTYTAKAETPEHLKGTTAGDGWDAPNVTLAQNIQPPHVGPSVYGR